MAERDGGERGKTKNPTREGVGLGGGFGRLFQPPMRNLRITIVAGPTRGAKRV
jgi:hypothetical protein